MNALLDKYLMILNKLGPNSETGAEIEATTEEVAGALYCTTRNAKLVIRKLADEGLIRWRAGRGRGNASRLAFLAEKDDLLLDYAQRLSSKGEYKQAFELFQAYDARDGGGVHEKYLQWLNGHFGYSVDSSEGNEAVDILRFPVYYPILSLDPAEIYCAFDAHIIRQLYDSLIHYDYSSDRVSPGLAHAWDINEDWTEFTLYLRKGARFHNGREISSEDVNFSLERLRGSRAMSWMVRGVTEIELLGPRSLRIRLARPNRIFHRYLSSAGMSIVPHDLVEKDERFFIDRPVGSGPFRLNKWTADRLELSSNKDYYLGRAHLDRVVIAFMPEGLPSKYSFSNWRRFLFDDTSSVEEPGPEWTVMEELDKGCLMMTWNLRKPGPHQSSAFRKAVDLLLNRRKMIEEVGGNRVYPARGYTPTERTPVMEDVLDEEEAKRLLRESGYDGETITLSIYGMHGADAEWLSRRLAEFDVRLTVRKDAKTKIGDPALIASADCIMFEVVIARDEVCEVENYFQEGNFIKESLGADALAWVQGQVEDALGSDSAKERTAVFRRIEDKIRDDNEVLFILHKKLGTLAHPTVKGVELNYLGWMDFKDIWLEPGASSRSPSVTL
ncbi:ABC transporter substrate-binding protein [Cohnella suwonensis]|uniref:ABC transporter substrate-binding protein n=1 Tax=Cohnella suwonensis TaxID=696072 RepID=A0ABW0LNS4_9BACL